MELASCMLTILSDGQIQTENSEWFCDSEHFGISLPSGAEWTGYEGECVPVRLDADQAPPKAVRQEPEGRGWVLATGIGGCAGLGWRHFPRLWLVHWGGAIRHGHFISFQLTRIWRPGKKSGEKGPTVGWPSSSSEGSGALPPSFMSLLASAWK